MRNLRTINQNWYATGSRLEAKQEEEEQEQELELELEP